MILCAGRSENFNFAKQIGVGLVEAAIGAALLAKDSTEPLIFIGTAGSYNVNTADIGSTVFVQKACQFELRGESLFPQEIAVNIPDFVSRETTWSICNSSSYITTSQEDAILFSKLGADIENMELFSVFSVAKKFNLQAVGILYITNVCNENARSDYAKNLPSAIKALNNVINF